MNRDYPSKKVVTSQITHILSQPSLTPVLYIALNLPETQEFCHWMINLPLVSCIMLAGWKNSVPLFISWPSPFNSSQERTSLIHNVRLSAQPCKDPYCSSWWNHTSAKACIRETHDYWSHNHVDPKYREEDRPSTDTWGTPVESG